MAFLKNLRDPSRRTAIKVPSEARYIRKVSSRIVSSLERYNLDEGMIFDIRLCVEEALRNAMVHGNKSDKSLSVRISYRVYNGVLNIEIEDEGAGFKLSDVADPTLEPQILKTSGRGVYLVRKLMDSVEYNDKGNKITMAKTLK